MTRHFPLLLGVTLALAAPLPATSQEAGAPALPLTARGNEPFWSILATPEGLRLTEPEGKGTVQTLPFTQATEGTILVLTTTDFTLRIDPALCRDDMSGMPYPFTATLLRAGTALNGCAGDPAALLAGDWTVTALDTAPLPAGVDVTLSFGDGRISGNSGCNRLSGGYAVTGEGLSFSAIATTRMACPAPQMETEQAVLSALAGITRFDIAEDGQLLLQSGEGITALTARR
ncbi:MAG: META domain-containing protein [Paracoccaceae bacterium]